MTKTLTAITAIAIAASSFAGAANASDQLAQSLGVAPGAYSTAELAQLKDAIEQDDTSRIANILKESELVGQNSAVTGSSTQLALALGVEPGVYSNAELAQLKDAIERDDSTRVKFLTESGQYVTRGSAAVSANEQLAASLGLETGVYDAVTLAALYLDATGSGD